MTGQSILLVGMMTEAHRHAVAVRPRPRAAERPLRPATPAAASPRTSCPRPDGFIVQRARQVLAEAVDLLERIVRRRRCSTAIADGTFGVMKRPADGGKGLDGVVERADGYVNPAIDLLEPKTARRPNPQERTVTQRPTDVPSQAPSIVRPYGDTTGDGMVQISFTLPVPARQARRGRRRCSSPRDGPGPRDASCTPRRWARTSPSSSSTAGSTTWSTSPRSRCVERGVPAAERQGDQPGHPHACCGRKLVVVGACIGTDAHTVGIDAILNVKGFAGEKGLEYYREIQVVNLGAQVAVAGARRAAPGRRTPTPSWCPRSSPRRTPTCTTPSEMAAAFREAYPTRAGMRPLLVVGGPRFDTVRRRPSSASTASSAGHHARRGRVLPGPRAAAAAGPGGGRADERQPTHRRRGSG